MTRTYPTPHGDKLKALLENAKLPVNDHDRVRTAVAQYDEWITALKTDPAENVDLLKHLVDATNVYKTSIELDLIYNSEEDFLYRQKGQLKLDNTILEEFFPYLVDERLIPGLQSVPNVAVGPLSCYAGLFFGPATVPLGEGGAFVKLKNQDFTVAERLFLSVSKDENTRAATDFTSLINVAYFAAELKTNLDKTMFQEAAATSRELKACVCSAKYLLICEWLDMPPIDTRTTAIDEVIILRKAKRLNSNVRSQFSSAVGRLEYKEQFTSHLAQHPLDLGCFQRVINHLEQVFPEKHDIDETTVLQSGYF